MFVQRVGVIGAGTMGAAIAEVMALNGFEVLLKDIDQPRLDAGLKRIEQMLDELIQFHETKADVEIARIEKAGVTLTDAQKDAVRLAKKPTYTRDRMQGVMGKVRPTTTYDGFDEVEVVIEAAVEDMRLKQKVFRELEEHTARHCVLATNTSVLSVSEIAAGTKDRRSRVVGWHFFNPPTLLPLVEVIPGIETSPGVVDESVQFLEELRNHRFPMQPVVVKETPGFVVNRILGRALTEAFLLYEEGVASPRDIDKAIKTGLGWPMGPFELADMVGIDVIHHTAVGMAAAGFPAAQRAPQVIHQLFASGRLGRKTGRGFYDYTADTEVNP